MSRTILVNGRPYPVTVDERGVQRFVGNRIVRKLLNMMRERKEYGLNEIGMDYDLGLFTITEMHEFYRLLQYSVDGFREVFPKARIVKAGRAKGAHPLKKG